MPGGTARSACRATGTPSYAHPPLIWVIWAPVHSQEALRPGLHPFLGRIACHGGNAPSPYTGAGRDALPCCAGPLTPALHRCRARRTALRRGATDPPSHGRGSRAAWHDEDAPRRPDRAAQGD